MKHIKLFENFEIDQILDKISKYGKNSLTNSEEKILSDYSSHLNDGGNSEDFTPEIIEEEPKIEYVFALHSDTTHSDEGDNFVYIQTKEYWEENECVDGEKFQDIIIDGFEQIEESNYLIGLPLEEAIEKLISMGFKFCAYFQDFVDDSFEIDDKPAIEYFMIKYPEYMV